MKGLNVVANSASQKIQTLPRFVIEDHPKFVAFIRSYYEWLATENSDLGFESLKLSNDIDLVPETLLDGFRNSYAKNIPEFKGDFRHFAKFLKEFYQLRGTPESFRMFFNAAYQAKVNIEFPRQYVLKPSDSTWVSKRIILAEKVSGDPLRLEGKDFGKFTIESVVQQNPHYRLEVRINETPEVGETFSYDQHEIRILGQWEYERVENSKTYHEGDLIRKDDMIFRVERVFSSGIERVEILNGGSGYQKDEVLHAVTDHLGSGFKAVVESVSPDGSIESVKVTRTGFGFIHEDVRLQVETENGTFAELKPHFSDQFRKIKHLIIEKNAIAGEESKTLDLGEGETIHLTRTSSIVEYNGKKKDMPSTSFARIHDSDYYQEYSYLITSTADTRKQEKSLRSLLHIAGLKMFVGTLVQGTSL